MSGAEHTERLDAALDGKYEIERKLGEGGRASANLQHPHVLPLFDSGEVRGYLYYATPPAESRLILVENFFEELRELVRDD